MKQLLEVDGNLLCNISYNFKYFSKYTINHICSICNKNNCLNLNTIGKSNNLCIVGLQFCNGCNDKYNINIADTKHICNECQEEKLGNYCSNCGHVYGGDINIYKSIGKRLIQDFGKDAKYFGRYKII